MNDRDKCLDQKPGTNPGKRAVAVQRLVRWQTHGGYQEAKGRECTITLEPRPHYCDRGNFIAKLHPVGELARSIDGCDLWPRYYFDESRAKLEIEAWLQKRGQLLPPNAADQQQPPEGERGRH